MTITWDRGSYTNQQIEMASAEQRLSFLEKSNLAITLHKASIPSSEEVYLYWNNMVGSSPVLGSKVQWWDTVNDEIGQVFIYTLNNGVPLFVASLPQRPANNWELLGSFYQEKNVASADQNIDIPATYTDLVVQATIQRLDVNLYSDLWLRVNNNAGAIYYSHFQGGLGNTFQNIYYPGNTVIQIRSAPGTQSRSDSNQSLYIHIPDYQSVFADATSALCISALDADSVNGSDTPLLGFFMGCLVIALGTAITQLNFLDSVGFVPGTKINVWGVYPV